MKRSDLLSLVAVTILAGVISLIIANLLFSPKKFSTPVPVVNNISSSFPDVTNDPSYNTFLNTNALDLTLPVQIGNNQNKTPFTNTSQ